LGLNVKVIEMLRTLRISWLLGIFLCLVGGTAFSARLEAQSMKPSPFRVDTDIYYDNTKAPIKRTLTLFSDGVFYDFEESDNGLVTVIDPGRNRIILLNRQRQVKTVLDTKQIQLMVSSARVQADAKIATVSKSLIEKAASGIDEAIVQNDFMEYRASLQQPPLLDMSQQYAEFADWSARLNAIYAPKLPPYLRLELNQLIASQHAIPNAIKRTTRERGQQMELTCRLIPVWRLSQDDLTKIARCGSMLAQFNEVTADEYWSAKPIQKASVETTKSR
jgi:hypothetical protein